MKVDDVTKYLEGGFDTGVADAKGDISNEVKYMLDDNKYNITVKSINHSMEKRNSLISKKSSLNVDELIDKLDNDEKNKSSSAESDSESSEESDEGDDLVKKIDSLEAVHKKIIKNFAEQFDTLNSEINNLTISLNNLEVNNEIIKDKMEQINKNNIENTIENKKNISVSYENNLSESKNLFSKFSLEVNNKLSQVHNDIDVIKVNYTKETSEKLVKGLAIKFDELKLEHDKFKKEITK